MIPKYDIRLIDYQGLESSLPEADLRGDFGLVIQVEPFPQKEGESKVISVQHTNLFSRLYHDLKLVIYDNPSLQRTVFLNLSDELENFDINFIGVLTLFKTHFPSIQFTLRLPGAGGYSAYARFRDSFFRIRAVYESISGIRPFEIADELVIKGRARETIDPMLIFPINPATFQRYFVDTRVALSSAELMKPVDSDSLFGYIKKLETAKGTAAEINYRKTRRIIGHFSNSIDWGNTNEIFFLEYCRMLSEFNLLQPNIELVRPGVGKAIGFKSFTKKGFKDFEMDQLTTGAKKIFDGLQGQPSYFTFLFSFLVNRNIGTMVVRDDEGEDGSLLLKQNLLLDRLKELLAFTRNLFLSIRELARNIIDHTEHRRGVITGRVYQGIQLRSIKDNSELKSGVESYLLEMDQQTGATSAPSEYFDLSIFDEGSAGMIEKTISNISNLAKGITVDSDLYTSDIALLKDGSVNIGDFFNAAEIKLNHNAIKTASHWGLIIFGSLIKKNAGLYKVQTKGRSGGLDTYYSGPLESQFSHIVQESKLFTGGTIFNVILPLDRTQGLKEQVVQPREVKDNDFSAKNYYELLKYSFLESDDQLKKGDRDVLTRLDISSFTGTTSMMDYRAEIAVADKLGARVVELKKICEDQIFVLDFEDCADSFDQSRLLRFLARLQLRHNLNDIIVFNIHAADLIPLRELADEESAEFDARSFWDPGHFVLIYSYIRNNDKRNYFTDILGGFRYSDLKKLRNKLSYTHHTNFAIGNSDSQGSYSAETLEGIASSKLFRSGTSGIVQK
ncbi:hypothetical protein [Pedobacter sp. MR22-3]|uniref:hypothetical protein n=1 Tax=Pedobacter sp. MR22-3 TaxID=2994552 RepID=UPI002245E995|nr:hypothetical protein [Pedobacter sp. MR22-3]MCX2585662.1 hypothetical protein [Pedobacter sp. MR22-3]